jgi:broad-specificity NMP kinase
MKKQHIIIAGSPGSGKTRLADRLASIMSYASCKVMRVNALDARELTEEQLQGVDLVVIDECSIRDVYEFNDKFVAGIPDRITTVASDACFIFVTQGEPWAFTRFSDKLYEVMTPYNFPGDKRVEP